MSSLTVLLRSKIIESLRLYREDPLTVKLPLNECDLYYLIKDRLSSPTRKGKGQTRVVKVLDGLDSVNSAAKELLYQHIINNKEKLKYEYEEIKEKSALKANWSRINVGPSSYLFKSLEDCVLHIT